MRRATLLASALGFAPLIALAPSLPAYAGLAGASISITHSPSTFTVGEDGTFTVSLSSTENIGEDIDYDVIDTVPASFTISGVDQGEFECTTDNAAHTVECTISAGISSTNTQSFVIHTTPSTALGSPFTDTASYSFQEVPTTSGNAKHARPALNITGPTATDMVAVDPAATKSPTPTPTPTPTHTPTHHPTHSPTPAPSPTVSATHASTAPVTLPNTGGSDLAQLVAIGALLIAAGGLLAAVTRRRRA